MSRRFEFLHFIFKNNYNKISKTVWGNHYFTFRYAISSITKPKFLFSIPATTSY